MVITGASSGFGELAALQAFRVLTPPLYRWGMGAISRRHRASGTTPG